jgi:tetratricopeptide (TPR) repeat protein
VLAIGGDIPAAEAFPKANAAAQKAIEIDDTLGEALDALGMGLFWNGWDWNAAEKECLRGIKLNPNNAESHGNYAGILSTTGRHAATQQGSKQAADKTAIRPFQVNVPEAELTELRQRIIATR